MKLVFWLLVAVALFYAFYVGTMAGWSYLTVSNVVQQAVEERPRAARADRVRQVREDILKRAARTGVPLEEGAVDVTQSEGSLGVRVRWTYPVITLQDGTVLAIPLSVERLYSMSDPATR
jgi:hypothetical protein